MTGTFWPELRHHVAAGRGLLAGSRRWSVAVHWTRRPARMPPACRLVRPAKTIMTSLPKFWATFGLAHPQPLARRHHQGDRHDAPGDPEHGEERCGACAARSVREGVADEVAEGHGASLGSGYCRTTCSPSSTPSTSSVLTPFEMPELHRHLALPAVGLRVGHLEGGACAPCRRRPPTRGRGGRPSSPRG